MNTIKRLRPVRVHLTASRRLETGRLREEPAWYRIVGSILPTTSLVRPLPVQHKDHKPWTKRHKPRGMFMPQKIEYPEDKLRMQFFKDHPWELARPRILVENDGNDHKHYDWSNIEQPGKQLDGESVVQRQMWLMENKGLEETDAYDHARREFYELRMKQDIERRVAAEEALAVGAHFGKSYLEIGIEMEQKALEMWKEVATADIIKRRGRSTFTVSDFEEEPEAPVAEAEEQQVAAA